MNPKSKIILIVVFIFSIFLGFSPILLLNFGFNNVSYNQEEKYPSPNNPYFTQYDHYSSGGLPNFLSSYDTTISEFSYYYNLIDQAFGVTQEELQLLEQNKFVVLNRMGTDDIVDAYLYYWQNDLPIFITTDSMLHI